MLDNKDESILEILEKNARTSYIDIAKKLNLSEAAIRKRVKKLEENNVILGYKASVNYKKLGYSNKIIIGVDTSPQDYFSVIEKLKNTEFVKNLSTSSGDHMIIFEIWVKDMGDLHQHIKKINNIEGVTQTCPSILHENIC